MTDAQSLAFAGGLIGGIFVTFGFFLLIFYVLLVIALWKIFTKAGEEGWKAIIPIYNTWVLCKIIGVNFWIWVIAVPIIGGIVVGLLGEKSTFGTLINFAITLVIDIEISVNLAKSFGKSGSFAVGLILLPNIFQMILGFGSAEYIGPSGEKVQE